MLTKEQILNFPIQHISFSAIRSFLTDRNIFKKRYILLQYDNKTFPAIEEGRAAHYFFQKYYESKKNNIPFLFEKELAMAEKIIDESTEKGFVDYGKTGSQQKSKDILSFVASEYIKEMDNNYKKIVDVEKKITTKFFDLNENEMPIMLKGFIDLIVEEENGDITIVDHKVVTTPYAQEDIVPEFELQAGLYYFLVLNEYGKAPTQMIFDQIKKNKNREGGSQIYPYIIKYNEKILLTFLSVYSLIIQEIALLSDAKIFLPNPFDIMSGAESWKYFCEEISI